jgi:hypothetical protein
MSETAAHLVDAVLPRVPVRQWVLSVPKRVRYWLARDAKLLGRTERIFVEEIFRDLRRRAGEGDGHGGAMTSVQRFGSALNLNVHFHTLVLDGVYVASGPRGELRFRRGAAPSREELERVLSRVRRRVTRMLVARGVSFDAEGESEEPGFFDVVQASSVREWVGLADEPMRVSYIGAEEAEVSGDAGPPPFCVAAEGWSLHAAVRIRAGDRRGLEAVCRYVLRPAFAGERVERMGDGRVLYRLRRPRRDGSTHMILQPLEFVGKLAALVAPPRSHLVRYHGVLAPRSRLRSLIVPGRGESSLRDRKECEAGDAEGLPVPARRRRRRRPRSDWATLLMRSLELDALACPKCGGRMRLIACIVKRSVVRAILRSLGEPEEAEGPDPARAPPASSEAGSAFEVDQSKGTMSHGQAGDAT